MTLTNYKTANNANSTLASGIGAGATSLVCATGQGGRFPSTFPFLMTIEKTVAEVVTKREIVKVTNRSSDAFTIVRSAGYCLASDSATTQTNTAQSFDADDVISLRLTGEIIDDLNAEAVRLESAKLDKSGGIITGLIQGAKSANIASATTTNLANATGNEVHITGTTTITGLGTVTAGTQISLIFDGILTFTHNVTSLILPGSTNITTAAGDIAIMVSEGSGNWKCLSYTRADGTALAGVNITSLTEDTAGDMDADFAIVYDNSAGANRKQKMNVYRATSGDITTGTTTTKFPSVAQVVGLLNNSSGTSSKNLADASGTQTIAHGLGRIPKNVKITLAATAGTTNPYAPFTVYNGTTQSSLSYYGDGSSFGYRSATGALLLGDSITARYQSGVVTFDATNITITWTKIGSPTGILPLIWEVE